MNHKGSSNAFFVIIIPILLTIGILIADTIISYSENKKYKAITEKIITKVYNDKTITEDNYFNEIKRLYEREGYETTGLVVVNDHSGLNVENEHYYFGLFSSLKKNTGTSEEAKFFGITYIKKKNSKVFIKVKASKDLYNTNKKNSDEIKFEYEK